MWFSCKKTVVNTFPVTKRVKLAIKIMVAIAVVLYVTLVLCQNVNGYQGQKVSLLSGTCNIWFQTCYETYKKIDLLLKNMTKTIKKCLIFNHNSYQYAALTTNKCVIQLYSIGT